VYIMVVYLLFLVLFNFILFLIHFVLFCVLFNVWYEIDRQAYRYSQRICWHIKKSNGCLENKLNQIYNGLSFYFILVFCVYNSIVRSLEMSHFNLMQFTIYLSSNLCMHLYQYTYISLSHHAQSKFKNCCIADWETTRSWCLLAGSVYL
jgi:hypothetical protein